MSILKLHAVGVLAAGMLAPAAWSQDDEPKPKDVVIGQRLDRVPITTMLPSHLRLAVDPRIAATTEAHERLGASCKQCHAATFRFEPANPVLAFNRQGDLFIGHGDLGLQVAPVDAAARAQLGIAEKEGVVVVAPGSNDGMKLETHDIILKVDGKAVASKEELHEALSNEGKDPKTIVVLRGGKKLELKVESAGQKHEAGWLEAKVAEQSPLWIGVSLGTLEPALRSQLGLKEGEGVVATSVVEKSPAAKAGLKANDILLAIAADALGEPDQLIAAVQASKGEPVELKVLRAGKPMSLKVKPEKRPADVAQRVPGMPAGPNPTLLLEALRAQPGVVLPSPEGLRYRVEGLPPSFRYQPAPAVPTNEGKGLDERLDRLEKQLDALTKSIDGIAAEKKKSGGR
ncbi:MAG: PDZ domain-containing protein [Isosphaeraceae bacterium]|nr:PDZ domain-containing protein [Isosphaeraceae bacterium]